MLKIQLTAKTECCSFTLFLTAHSNVNFVRLPEICVRDIIASKTRQRYIICG